MFVGNKTLLYCVRRWIGGHGPCDRGRAPTSRFVRKRCAVNHNTTARQNAGVLHKGTIPRAGGTLANRVRNATWCHNNRERSGAPPPFACYFTLIIVCRQRLCRGSCRTGPSAVSTCTREAGLSAVHLSQ